jgi:hypothetical protein
MNTNNFKTFVETLEALPASIKGDEVNIGSFLKPDHMCGDAGCFAGLISIVPDDIPELKQEYKGKFYNRVLKSYLCLPHPLLCLQAMHQALLQMF